ncbi:MAG: hypothetical protein N2116_03255 [Armatimonadetes bacterium]|nr:hypothetical protein [Armatimonadota bacterium]
MGSWFAISDVTVPLKMSTPFRFTVISDHHAGAGGQSLDKARKAIQKAMGKRPDASFCSEILCTVEKQSHALNLP